MTRYWDESILNEPTNMYTVGQTISVSVSGSASTTKQREELSKWAISPYGAVEAVQKYKEKGKGLV